MRDLPPRQDRRTPDAKRTRDHARREAKPRRAIAKGAIDEALEHRLSHAGRGVLLGNQVGEPDNRISVDLERLASIRAIGVAPNVRRAVVRLEHERIAGICRLLEIAFRPAFRASVANAKAVRALVKRLA